MPIWFHKGQANEEHPQNNGKWAECQRHQHNIQTVGEMAQYVSETLGIRHFIRINCACAPCKASREKGCSNPAKCRQAGQKLLESLYSKWRPTRQSDEDELKLSEEQLQQNRLAQGLDGAHIFDPDITSTSELTKEFRVFVNNDKVKNTPAKRPPKEQGTEINEEVIVHVCGVHAHDDQGYETARSAYTVWFGNDDQRNSTQRTKGTSQTKETAECQAFLQALTLVPSEAKLTIRLASPYVKGILTKSLQRLEDRGWIATPNREILQTIVASLRARNNHTVIERVQEKETIIRLTELAKAGLTLDNEDEELDLIAPETFQLTGLRLSEVTQSMLYQGILETRKRAPRNITSYNLGITRACVEELTGKSPTDEKIWESLKSKDFPCRIRAFLWKAMHGAYKCGKYWANIPTCEHRGTCHACDGVEDSMEHILTECRASGQEEVWKAAEELWALRGLPWVQPRFGTILGCNLANFHSERSNRKLPGANRLYAILISESAHLIWRTRCKWKITNEAALDRLPPAQEMRDTWVKNINRRLQLERLMTDNIKYGKKALKATLVEKTWWGVLRDQESLQEDWLKKGTGVLVGIGDRPPGRNR